MWPARAILGPAVAREDGRGLHARNSVGMAQVRTPFIPSFPPAFSSIPVTVSEFSSSIPTPNPPATQESEPHSQQPKSNQKSTPESDNMSSSRDGPVPEPTPQQQLPSPAEEPVPEQQPESLPALSHQEQDEQLRRTLVQKVTPYAEELICLELVQSNEFREDKDLWRGPNGPSPRFYAFVKDTTEQVPDMSREHLSKLYTMLRKVTWLADLTGECWPDPHIPHYMSEEWGYEVTSYDKKMRSVFSFFILLHLGTEWHAGIEEELLYPAWKKRTVVQEEVRASWARLGDGPAETDTFFWENWDQENNVRFFYLNSHIPFLVHAMLHSWANRVQGHAPVPCYNDEELGASSEYPPDPFDSVN